MRKLMLLAAMLAMVLVAAAPALAQDAVAGDVDNSTDTTYINVDCSQVQDAAAAQYGGDAVALGDAAAASVANELGISQEQVNACLGGVAGGEDVEVNGVDDDADGVVDEAGEVAVAEAEAAAEAGAAEAGAAAVLPDTGGASLFTLGAGALLVGGGLLARRIFR